ncbi:MAG TPA: c-type cytochrome, partial [Polyangiaceae bacterium LLY-WYZ-15_(1-7)]|nr:c-type cytochrome [Polyangiaceae bacterium LLY-WYZ-15_(1-7)]
MRPLATLSFAFVLALSARAAADPPADEALFERHGCTACHSLDGAPHLGPTLAGLAGRERPLADGTTAR